MFNGPNIVTSGLVLALDAANTKSYPGSGTTWFDISENGNNGTITNGPTFSNNSILFDGTNDYIITTVNSTPTLNITSQITLESWIISTALANTSHGSGIISKGLSSDNNSAVYEMLLVQSSSINYPFFRMRIGSTTPTYNPTNIPISLNQIYQIVSTYDNNIIRIYVNGVESGTGLTQTGSIQINTQQLTIGVRYLQRGSTGNSFFAGKMYNSKIYNRALSSSEIEQNYNSTKSRFNL